MTSESIKINIRRKREELRLTQQEMAERLGLSRTAYRNIEDGRTKLVSDKLQPIADIFGISPGELVMGFDPVSFNVDLLKEENDHKEKIREITDYYETRLKHMNETLELKDGYIRTQNDIINRLNTQLDRYSKD